MEIKTKTIPIDKPIWSTLGVLAIVFLALSVADKGYSLSKNFNAKPDNTISVSGEGKVAAKPDIATVTIGVTNNAATAKVAQDRNTESMNKIIDYVKQQGVADKDITTSNFSVFPNYDYNGGTNRIISYNANQTLTIKVRDVDKSTATLSEILSGALDSGSNQIQGVYFGFDDSDALRQEARKQAIEKAKQKAQELADASGIKLGKVVSIQENSVYFPTPYLMDATRAEAGMGGGGTPPIQAGSQDVTATMTVIFEVK
jgi:uncharacterized protein YggE